MQINPYLMFNGNCEDAFNFYAKVFSSKLNDIHRYANSPMEDQVPADFRNRVMHTSMNIANIVLMGSDSPPEQGFAPIQGTSLSISVPTAEEAERVFAALADGGKVTMPIASTFWALRFGMLTDRFGTPWMVNCDHPQQG
ncbi:VOC family protein [Massilia endophytica]|uniref:VOC family protein n=1 Tax=Massilia endophytica TaxID=2899220 RepID=UPI001E30B27C|nr:VOC family protein [Massilia endophytica]UGQ49158.1 VOC family protein [Massilia endophytica]